MILKDSNYSSSRPTYDSKGFQRISTAQVPGRPTDSKGFQRISKDSKIFGKVAKDSKDSKKSKELISKELKEPARAQKKLMSPLF